MPSSVFANTWQGSYKDTISRIAFIQQNDNDYRQIRLDHDDPEIVRAVLGECRDAKFLIEYTSFPRTLKWIRQAFPKSFIAVRSHNLEPLQHLDNNGWWPRRGPLWVLYGMLRLAAADLANKRYADVIYSISEWENQVYWNRLPGRARVEWLPYHCPGHLLPDTTGPSDGRRRIACLPTSQQNRKSRDLVNRFIRFAEQMQQCCGGRYEFVVTGDLSQWELPYSDAVTFTGLIDDLRSFLQTVHAVCLLSPLGHGFKTTIGDSIAHGCHVLVHPVLARRCPGALTPAIIPVDSDQASDVVLAFERLSEALLVAQSLNGSLRAMNHRILATDFGLESVQRCRGTRMSLTHPQACSLRERRHSDGTIGRSTCLRPSNLCSSRSAMTC